MSVAVGYMGDAAEVGWAVVVAAAVLVSGVALRAGGRWVKRSLSRDFDALVRNATRDDMASLNQSITLMREEQTEQHGVVREDVARLCMQMGEVDRRLDRIEHHIYPVTKE